MSSNPLHRQFRHAVAPTARRNRMFRLGPLLLRFLSTALVSAGIVVPAHGQAPISPDQLTNRRYARLNDVTSIGWNPALLGVSSELRTYDMLAGIGFDGELTAAQMRYALFAKVGPLAMGTSGFFDGDSTSYTSYRTGYGLRLTDGLWLGAAAAFRDGPERDEFFSTGEYTLGATARLLPTLYAGFTAANITANNGNAPLFDLSGAVRGTGWGGIHTNISYDRSRADGRTSDVAFSIGASADIPKWNLVLSAGADFLNGVYKFGVELIYPEVSGGVIGVFGSEFDPPFGGGVAFARYSFDPSDTVKPVAARYRPPSAQGWAPDRSYVPEGLDYKFPTLDATASHDAVVKSCLPGSPMNFESAPALVDLVYRAGGPYLRLSQKLDQISPDPAELLKEIGRRYYSRSVPSRELIAGDSLAIVSRQGYGIGINRIDNSGFPLVSVIMQVTDGAGRSVPELGRNDFSFRDSTMEIVSVRPIDATASVPVDIVLLMDCSGSMGDKIISVQNNVQSFVRNMEERGADYRIGGVLFGSIVYDTLHPTADLEEFRRFVAGAAPIGNDEVSTLALKDAAAMNFRPDAQRVFIMITDDWVVQDNARLTETDLTEMLWRSSARLYTIMNPCRNNSAVMTRLTLGREYNISSRFNTILDDIGTDITTSYKLVYRSRLSRAEAGVAEPVATLRGVVRDAAGRPVRAQLLLRDTLGNRLRDVETEADGSFRIGIAEGMRYTVQINAERFRPKSDSLDLSSIRTGDTVTRDFVLERSPTTVAGYVRDELDRPVAAGIDIVDASTSQIVAMIRTDPSGYYETTIKEGATYRVTPIAPGYRPFVTALDARDVEPGTRIRQDLILSSDLGAPIPPVEPPPIVTAPPTLDTSLSASIFFDNDKWRIRKESWPVLDNVVEFVKRYPEMRVEIGAHTDANGDDRYNMGLSEKRADAVLEYFVSKGIDRSRLSARGYGETVPIAPNRTYEGRARNRRVEFRTSR